MQFQLPTHLLALRSYRRHFNSVPSRKNMYNSVSFLNAMRHKDEVLHNNFQKISCYDDPCSLFSGAQKSLLFVTRTFFKFRLIGYHFTVKMAQLTLHEKAGKFTCGPHVFRHNNAVYMQYQWDLVFLLSWKTCVAGRIPFRQLLEQKCFLMRSVVSWWSTTFATYHTVSQVVSIKAVLQAVW